MLVSINLKPLAAPDCGSLEELIDFVERQSLPAGEVITRIVINGEELDEERESQLAASALASDSVIEFYSERTLDLARRGIEDARELLPALAADLPSVAAELRAGNLRDGLEMFARCVEVVSWYVSLVTALDILMRRVAQGSPISADNATTAEDLSPEDALEGIDVPEGREPRSFASVENLRQKLMEIERAQQNNDVVLLADLIEYEILPIVKLWADELPLMAELLRNEGASA